MRTVGPGACEIRVRDREGAFRVLYVARFRKAIYVLARARYRDAKALDEE